MKNIRPIYLNNLLLMLIENKNNKKGLAFSKNGEIHNFINIEYDDIILKYEMIKDNIIELRNNGKFGIEAFSTNNGIINREIEIPAIFDDIKVYDYVEEDDNQYKMKYVSIKDGNRYGLLKIGYETIFNNKYKTNAVFRIINDLKADSQEEIDYIFLNQIKVNEKILKFN